MNNKAPKETETCSPAQSEITMSQKRKIFRRFSDYSIKNKLVIFTLLSTLTALILALSTIISFDRVLTKAYMVEEVQAISQILAVRSEVALTFGDKRNSQSNLDSLKNSREYVLACLYGRNNELYAQFPNHEDNTLCPKKPPHSVVVFKPVTSSFIHQWTEIKRNGQEQIGHLYMRRSLDSLNQRLTKFSIISACISFLVLVIGSLIILRLQRIISKPILDLSAISVKIAEDNDYQRRAVIAGQDEIGTLSHSFNKMLDTIEKKDKELKFMAFNDALTGLPNRRYFMETLERSLTSVSKGYRSIALFLIDLDGFKGVNDTIGHDAGDMVLTTVSQRMPNVLRKSDMVARLGGDEFTIIISDISTPETIRKIALKIIAAIEEPIEFKGQPANVSASIGIARAPYDGMLMDNVMKLADAAMYRAKAGGKKTFYFYDEAVDTQMKAFGALESEIQSQLAKKVSTLRYQPILSLETQELQGFVLYLDCHLENTLTDGRAHFSTIRYIADESIANEMLSYMMTMIIGDIAQLNESISGFPNMKLILSVTNEQLESDYLSTQLAQLTQQLEIKRMSLLLAVDRGGLESQNEALQKQLILSDDGNGIENLGAIDDIEHIGGWCLASLPHQHSSDWEQAAWKSLTSSALHSQNNIVGINMNTQEQKDHCTGLGIAFAAGDLLCQPLTVSELAHWLQKKSDSFVQ